MFFYCPGVGLSASGGGLAAYHPGAIPRRLAHGGHEHVAQVCQSVSQEWSIGEWQVLI